MKCVAAKHFSAARIEGPRNFRDSPVKDPLKLLGCKNVRELGVCIAFEARVPMLQL